MADSRRPSSGDPRPGKGGRQQRTEDVEVPGATGESQDAEASPDEAREEAEHRLGKTRKHVSEP
ncbi:MAG TPA: hypothetical protein VFS11_02285 [Gemmatimonadales bacterium]|nr:hypothetical protein [Gemmatimonadales bacterium]